MFWRTNNLSSARSIRSDAFQMTNRFNISCGCDVTHITKLFATGFITSPAGRFSDSMMKKELIFACQQYSGFHLLTGFNSGLIVHQWALGCCWLIGGLSSGRRESHTCLGFGKPIGKLLMEKSMRE